MSSWPYVVLMLNTNKNTKELKPVTDRQSLHWFTQTSWFVTFHGCFIFFVALSHTKGPQPTKLVEAWNIGVIFQKAFV